LVSDTHDNRKETHDYSNPKWLKLYTSLYITVDFLSSLFVCSLLSGMYHYTVLVNLYE